VSLEKNFGWKPTDSGESKFVVKEFNNEVFLVNERGEVIEVSEKGSLAFLGLGSIGHEAWQKAKSISNKNA
tara:strand:- start:213 stop:425 length:213 start_codon:yes stop_codon:yes gene_type:complete